MATRDLTRSTGPRGVMPLSEAMNQLFRDAFTGPFGAGAPGLTHRAIRAQLGFCIQQIAWQPDQTAAQVHLRGGDTHGPGQTEWRGRVDEAGRLKEKVR